MWFSRWLDRRIGDGLNHSKDLNLPPAASWFCAADYQPQSILGLFPEWYATRQPDRPRIRYAGFPLFDGGTNPEVIEQVEQFLTGKILRSSLPTCMTQAARKYFQSAMSAVERIGAGAILLSSFAGNVPPKLPASVGYFAYVPLERLLPQAAAIMHQGGIGTVAATLRAGVPQLVVPVRVIRAAWRPCASHGRGIGATKAAVFSHKV